MFNKNLTVVLIGILAVLAVGIGTGIGTSEAAIMHGDTRTVSGGNQTFVVDEWAWDITEFDVFYPGAGVSGIWADLQTNPYGLTYIDPITLKPVLSPWKSGWIGMTGGAVTSYMDSDPVYKGDMAGRIWGPDGTLPDFAFLAVDVNGDGVLAYSGIVSGSLYLAQFGDTSYTNTGAGDGGFLVGGVQVSLGVFFPVVDYSTTANTSRVLDFSYGAVPEPATMTLLALGGLAMLRRRRRS